MRTLAICHVVYLATDFHVICDVKNHWNVDINVLVFVLLICLCKKSIAKVDWTFERMIVLSCGHVYTADSLDHLMEMNEYYEKDSNDQWIGLKTITSQPSDPKSCPQCRAPIKNICRYGRAIKKNVLDIQSKKFLVKYDSQLKKRNKDITNATKQLENKRAEFLKEIQMPLKAKKMNKIEKNSA
ncbi:hypothetical protein C2G38_2130706, partial [Gigaspora rosea]